MSSQSNPNPETQESLLKIVKAITSMPAQLVYYGSALAAIAAVGGVDITGSLGALATGIGINALSNILERIAKGDEIPDEEIRKVVEDAVSSLGIETLVTNRDFYRAIAHVFRQFDLINYAVQKGEGTIATILCDQSAKHEAMLNVIQEKISALQTNLETLSTRDQSAEILKTVKQIAVQDAFSNPPFPISLIDREIEGECRLLQKSRFFVEYDRINSPLALAKRLIDGDLSRGTGAVRSRALAWIARVLSRTPGVDKAEGYLEFAKELGTGPEIRITQAFIHSQKGDKGRALNILASIDEPSSRSAALMIVAYHDGPQGAVDWLKAVGSTAAGLDADGKNSLLTYYLQLFQWKAAKECLDALTSQDLDEAPILNHLIAITHLLSAVPNELRVIVLNQIPFEVANFPLNSGDAAVNARRAAYRHFTNAAQVARQLNCPLTATLDEDYALWLALRDPDLFEQGREKLKAKLRDPQSSLRLVHFGLQFGIPLDLDAVEREINRQIVLHGGITQNAAIARFALAFTQKTPIDVANYVAQHRDELATYYDKKLLQYLEIEMLSKAGLLEKANDCLNHLLSEGLSEADESHLRGLIAEAEGADPVETRKKQYKTTGLLVDLTTLVDELRARRDWNGLCDYGQILFDQTHSLHDAESLSTALYNTQKTEQLVGFIKTNADLLAQSKILQFLFCWSLYYEGALLEARSELAKLSKDSDDPNYHALQINIAITLGDWNSLFNVVENEYFAKDKRSAQELISAAQLALHMGSPYAKDLIFLAADRGKDDAGILASAYLLASNAGWEDDTEVNKWLLKAVTLSGDNGPIQKKTLKDIIDSKPEWDRREAETWQMYIGGELPMFLAAQSFNKSLIDLMLVPALTNQSENDPRRRVIIPAYSGKRQPTLVHTRGKVGLDATALLTLSYLNLLDRALNIFDTVYVPYSTLIWLFEEKQKAAFHQPSRIRDAHQIRNMLATGVIEKFIASTVPDGDLASQVGDELALLIAEAEKVRDNDDPQRIVVRSSPVHRIASLMEEEADLSSHAAVLSSCQAIVYKLRQKAQITAEEERKALAYLQLHEKPWPSQPEIDDGAILYLDDLTITYFLHTGILDRVSAAGYRTIASPRKVTETNEFIIYERISGNVNILIERLRSTITSRIESGKTKLGRRISIDDPESELMSRHPTVGVIALAKDCDAIISDDRFLNQHVYAADGSANVPIYTTLDLIDALFATGSITQEEGLEYRTKLRRAGYFFVPIGHDELTSHLNTSMIMDNNVLETAELKAIRESFLRVRMSTWLQLPNEVSWLDTSLTAFIRVLKGLWKAGDDLSSIRARSDWLIEQIDFRGWAHRLGNENGDYCVTIGRGAYILMMLTPPLDASPDIKAEYWNWVEERILAPIKEQYPLLYSWIVNWYKKQIAGQVDTYLNTWRAE